VPTCRMREVWGFAPQFTYMSAAWLHHDRKDSNSWSSNNMHYVTKRQLRFSDMIQLSERNISGFIHLDRIQITPLLVLFVWGKNHSYYNSYFSFLNFGKYAKAGFKCQWTNNKKKVWWVGSYCSHQKNVIC